jgi:acyl-[acyl-carrier-protein]-phospholipid O-acyltransferase/long-chain-fatty-acid--[acyl-carrier-protein] ligase
MQTLKTRIRIIIVVVGTLGIGGLAATGIIVPSNIGSILSAIGAVVLLATAVTLVVRPYLVIRLAIWGLIHTVYRLTVVGREHIPAEGGALLVSNAVSFIDHAIILISLPRPVHLFVGREFYEHPLINPLARAVNAIPVDSTDNPKAIGRSLKEARTAIRRGEVVCVFAEGNITRTGNLLPFGRGFEFVMRGLTTPIIPMHLDRIWGSTFSMVDGKVSWRWPKIVPYPVTISFGLPMPGDTKASAVRLAVQELSAEAFKLRGKSQKKLHLAFLYETRRHPFKFCMADSLGVHLSYGKALAGMLAFAQVLFPKKNDTLPEEKVGLLLPTSCAAALMNGAAMFAGKIPVNLNYTASRENIRSCVRQCAMRTVVTSRAFLEKVGIEPDERMVFLEDVLPKIGAVRRAACYLAVLLLPARVTAAIFARGNRTSVDDVATIIFSSGTTGEPKGVMLTHRNIASNTESCYQVFNLKSRDIIMCVLPFFHAFGYTATLWFPMNAGVGMVIHTNPLDAATVGALTARYGATIIMGTPTFLAAYARKCPPEQFASLRFVVAGAEKLKKGIAETFYRKFKVPPFEGYGCTELSPIVSLGIPSYIHPEGKFVQVGNKPGTVGHPIPGVAARIVHPETLQTLPANTEGLLLIKGPNVMKGYLHDPAKTDAVIRDGWYCSGDIAMIDEDGFITITDRLSRFSKIGGEMVPHIKIEAEIEQILDRDDRRCVVTAVADDRRGERLVVLYEGDIDVDSLWKRLRERDLPRLWLPKRECFHKVEKIPMLGSGKLDLKGIRDMAQKLSPS